MRDKFDQVIHNEPFTIKTGAKALELACCDCGLVHVVGISVVDPTHVRFNFCTDFARTDKRRQHNLGSLLDGRNPDYVLLRL